MAYLRKHCTVVAHNNFIQNGTHNTPVYINLLCLSSKNLLRQKQHIPFIHTVTHSFSNQITLEKCPSLFPEAPTISSYHIKCVSLS